MPRMTTRQRPAATPPSTPRTRSSTPSSPVTDRDDHQAASEERGGGVAASEDVPPGEQGGLPRRLDLKSGVQEIRFLIDGWRNVDAAQ